LGMGFMTLPDPYKEPRTNNDEQRLRRFVLGWASDPHKEHGTKNQEPRVNGQAELLRHARDADERGVVGNVGGGVHGWCECTGFFGIYKRKGMRGANAGGRGKRATTKGAKGAKRGAKRGRGRTAFNARDARDARGTQAWDRGTGQPGQLRMTRMGRMGGEEREGSHQRKRR
jgi:hypothetical protein